MILNRVFLTYGDTFRTMAGFLARILKTNVLASGIHQGHLLDHKGFSYEVTEDMNLSGYLNSTLWMRDLDREPFDLTHKKTLLASSGFLLYS